ncbi:hypothetical protein BAUCODRAFT_121651 [Baudoinia panamericana UAMH 10762]|uniref:Uncharacterized protein n=1 Tax=Baudoinia panamericana (strain UAMH 10762) TaxID=717646 RepID=M2MZT9_BAUPA|nr:uncharacterized protein BAUCODRAFT_121651 [Baudoinia panamericana UAMH 10762]EMC97148.1 hypothetical protein BAUCODRAFT_121651 [Baudoinia panamericana UAMH 10762]
MASHSIRDEGSPKPRVASHMNQRSRLQPQTGQRTTLAVTHDINNTKHGLVQSRLTKSSRLEPRMPNSRISTPNCEARPSSRTRTYSCRPLERLAEEVDEPELVTRRTEVGGLHNNQVESNEIDRMKERQRAQLKMIGALPPQTAAPLRSARQSRRHQRLSRPQQSILPLLGQQHSRQSVRECGSHQSVNTNAHASPSRHHSNGEDASHTPAAVHSSQSGKDKLLPPDPPISQPATPHDDDAVPAMHKMHKLSYIQGQQSASCNAAISGHCTSDSSAATEPVSAFHDLATYYTTMPSMLPFYHRIAGLPRLQIPLPEGGQASLAPVQHIPWYAHAQDDNTWHDSPSVGSRHYEPVTTNNNRPRVRSSHSTPSTLALMEPASSAKMQRRATSPVNRNTAIDMLHSNAQDVARFSLRQGSIFPSISSVLSLHSSTPGADSDFTRTSFTRREGGSPGEARRLSYSSSSRGTPSSGRSHRTRSDGAPSRNNSAIGTPARYHRPSISGRSTTDLQCRTSSQLSGSIRSFSIVEDTRVLPAFNSPKRYRNGSISSHDYGMIGRPVVVNGSINGSVNSASLADDVEREQAAEHDENRHPVSLPPHSFGGEASPAGNGAVEVDDLATSHKPSLVYTANDPSRCPENCDCEGCYTSFVRRQFANCDLDERLDLMVNTCKGFESIVVEIPSQLTLQLHSCIRRSQTLLLAQQRLHKREHPFMLEHQGRSAKESWNTWFEAFALNVRDLQAEVTRATAALAAHKEVPLEAKREKIGAMASVKSSMLPLRRRQPKEVNSLSTQPKDAKAECIPGGTEAETAGKDKKERMRWFGKRRIDSSVNF